MNEDDIGSQTVEGFLAGLASDSPTPGGGAVAALCGAAGAGLISMVCRLTVGRDAYEEVDAEMAGLLADADAARAEFLRLAGRDAAAFDAVMAAFKLPKDDDRRKAERSAAIQRAYEGAARVPLEVAELAIGLIAAATAVTERGNSNAASDGLSAAHALHAAAHAALANVAINAAGLKDERVATELRDRLEGGRRRADELLATARSGFEARVG